MNKNAEAKMKRAGLNFGMGKTARILTLGLVAIGMSCLLQPPAASAGEPRLCRHHGGFIGHLTRQYIKRIKPRIRPTLVKPALREFHGGFTRPIRDAAKARAQRELAPIRRGLRDAATGIADWIR